MSKSKAAGEIRVKDALDVRVIEIDWQAMRVRLRVRLGEKVSTEWLAIDHRFKGDLTIKIRSDWF